MPLANGQHQGALILLVCIMADVDAKVSRTEAMQDPGFEMQQKLR